MEWVWSQEWSRTPSFVGKAGIQAYPVHMHDLRVDLANQHPHGAVLVGDWGQRLWVAGLELPCSPGTWILLSAGATVTSLVVLPPGILPSRVSAEIQSPRACSYLLQVSYCVMVVSWPLDLSFSSYSLLMFSCVICNCFVLFWKFLKI